MPTLVFKTSDIRMKIAGNINRVGKHCMSDDFFFDGKVKRCRNFVTLTASAYHPLLKRQVPLAIMEAEKENSEHRQLFWALFNEALSKSFLGDERLYFKPWGGVPIWLAQI